MRHSAKDFINAARIWSLPASAMPTIVPACYLYMTGNFNAPFYAFLLLFLSVLLFHTAGNLLSDRNDYLRGVDTQETLSVKYLPDGIFTPKEILAYGTICIAAAAAAGIAILVTAPQENRAAILIIGILTAIGTCTYHYNKYKALGDLHIFFFFGIMTAAAVSIVIGGFLSLNTILISLCYSPSIVAILHANNSRDMNSDKEAGIKTLGMLLGKRKSFIYYIVLLVFQFAYTAALIIAGLLPLLSAAAFLSLPLLVKCIRKMKRACIENEKIADADQDTAKLQLIFCILLSASMIIEKFL